MAKTLTHPGFGASIPAVRRKELHIPNPDRTAYRVSDDGNSYTYQEWPSRAAMLQTIKMQRNGPQTRRWWYAVEAERYESDEDFRARLRAEIEASQ